MNEECCWDGRSEAFAQFVTEGSVSDLTNADHGIFEDIGSFYASGRGINKLNIGVRLLFGFSSRSANRRIEVLRNTAGEL